MANGMNIHDLNASIYAGMEPLKSEQVVNFVDSINKLHEKDNNKYYLLLSHDIRYYTIFKQEEFLNENAATLGEEVSLCLKYLGEIVDYNVEKNSMEIWIKQKEKAIFLMLMPWDMGVINFNR